MSNGIMIVHLHAHLPYVRHPEHKSFLEEDWLYEAMSECYIPLLQMMERLRDEGIPYRLSFTLSPTLCEMLADPLLRDRYRRRLEMLVELGEREEARTASDPELHRAASFHRWHFEDILAYYDSRGGDLIGVFRSLFESGHLEIVTCAATHAFLPFVRERAAARGQIATAVRNFQKHFGRRPRGIWLPECAYAEGLDELLAAEGIEYTFLDTHGLLFAEPCPGAGVWGPIESSEGVKFLGRDIESSRQVWSAREGYPGDPSYREFYRDVGWDADEDYIRPYLHPGAGRHNLGFKYHRITGDVDLSAKQPYDPTRALLTAREHAGNFHFNRAHQLRYLREALGRTPVVHAPYDAELFGHWWFEGPWFLEEFMRLAALHEREFRLGSALDAIGECGVERCEPSPSSWGDKGYYEVWLNESNQWMYPHQHEAERRAVEAVRRHGDDPRARPLLKTMLRQFLLAQSSDWAFIATTGTTVPYAVRRFREHVRAVLELAEALDRGEFDTPLAAGFEEKHPIFPELEIEDFREERP